MSWPQPRLGPPVCRHTSGPRGGAAWQVTAWGFCYHQKQLGCCKPSGVDTGPVPLASSGPYWGGLQPQIHRWQPLLSAPQLVTFEREVWSMQLGEMRL